MRLLKMCSVVSLFGMLALAEAKKPIMAQRDIVMGIPNSRVDSDLFSNIAFRSAYCYKVLKVYKPSSSGGHLPDFFAWSRYPKEMIKWKYRLNKLDKASKVRSVDPVKMKTASDLAMNDMNSMEDVSRKRFYKADCRGDLAWLDYRAQ